MTTEFVTLPRELTVGEALSRLREMAETPNMIYYLYVVEEEGSWKLSGVIALRSLILQFGWRVIPEEELARIAVPTTLIWGRHDRQTPLAVAQQASTRFGWPLHVIEDAADDPAFEQPEAVLKALSVTLAATQ